MNRIRKMGQWNPSVFDNSYSAKLPMGPMRKLAGFHGCQQMYVNIRTSVEVTDAEPMQLVLLACGCLVWQAFASPKPKYRPTMF